mmetsp:Transcript_13478/g.46905  ORF Transcript_13478/g.46905 Transcript_13478/m.46905 type:complete len:197 (-) Transcript_13478:470-1060(-)
MLHSAGPGSMHDNNEKEMWYEERVSENPSNVENLIKFAHFLQGIGKYDRAAKMYSTALQFDSEEARRQSYEITNSKNASIEIRSWEKTEIANLLEYNTLSQEWSARKVLLRWESSKPYSVGGQRESLETVHDRADQWRRRMRGACQGLLPGGVAAACRADVRGRVQLAVGAGGSQTGSEFSSGESAQAQGRDGLKR